MAILGAGKCDLWLLNRSYGIGADSLKWLIKVCVLGYCYVLLWQWLSLLVSIGKWLSSKATLTGVRMEQKCSDFFGLSFDRSAWVGVAQLDNTFNITDNLSLELNAIYQSSAIQGLFDLSESWGVDAGVKWSLLDNKLEISVMLGMTLGGVYTLKSKLKRKILDSSEGEVSEFVRYFE